MSSLLLIVGLLLFVGLVVVHEWGHFIAARKNGIEVDEFGIGFPPRACVLTKKNGTTYTLNWLPLGGFVKLKGEHDADTQKGSYGAASLSAKSKVMVAGVLMNLVTAWILLTLLALIGMPKLFDNQFTIAADTKVTQHQVLAGYIEPDSPAAKSGLRVRDELAAIGAVGQGKETITSADQLSTLTKKYAGQRVELITRRDDKPQPRTLTLRTQQAAEATKKGVLGVSPSEYTLQRSTWSAPLVGAGVIKQFTVLTFKGLGSVVAGLFRGNTAQATEQVGGPVAIFMILKDGSLLGVRFILMIIAIISLTLAIMNVLPIPALDGGRLFVTLLFRTIQRPLTQKREEWIHGSGFAFLMVLFLLITIVDIRRFF
jgi:regulator of sigma E protease